MPLVYQHNINEATRLAVWHITEPEAFFLEKVPLKKDVSHPHKRLQHLAGRYLLPFLFEGFPLEEILIADTRKPFLENEQYHFSISHCGDYAAAIVSKQNRVGVDVELKNKKIENILHKFLTVEECFLMPRGTITETATLFWSVKESIYKWNSRAGVDFKKHIAIKLITGNANEGFVHCVFNDAIKLDVHFLHFNDNYLTWVVTDH